MLFAIVLAALLPVVPQPTEWKPSEGTCPLAEASVVTTKVDDARYGEEGYAMTISPGRIEVKAKTDLGLLWARQTLAQLKAAGVKRVR